MTNYYGPYNHDDSVEGVVANDEWRHDPARQEAWRERIEECQAAYAEAHEHLRRAAAALRTLGPVSRDEDALVARGKDSVEMVLMRFDSDIAFVMQDPTEVYLGNKAAFGLPRGHSLVARS